VKSALKGVHFQSVDAVKLKMMDLLNGVSVDDLQYYFERWKIHTQQCIGEENMLKGLEMNL
jgi:hypothetical protein